MNKKLTIIMAILAVITLALILFFVSKLPKKNASGWESTEIDINASWGTEIENSVNYHIEHVSKEDFLKMSETEYVDTVTSVLNAYSGKMWTLFAFDDGTGIFYPGSDPLEKATYGKFNDGYIMTDQMGFIEISGRTVTYSEVPYYRSSDSKNLLAAIPQDYSNDTTFAAVKDNIGYIEVYITDDKDENTVANELVEAAKKVNSYDEIRICITKGTNVLYFRWKNSNMETIAVPDADFFPDIENEESVDNGE